MEDRAQMLLDYIQEHCNCLTKKAEQQISVKYSDLGENVALGYESDPPTILVSLKNWKILASDLKVLNIFIFHEVGHHFTLDPDMCLYTAELEANKWVLKQVRYKKYAYLYDVFINYLKEMSKLKITTDNVTFAYKTAAETLLKEIKEHERKSAIRAARKRSSSEESVGST